MTCPSIVSAAPVGTLGPGWDHREVRGEGIERRDGSVPERNRGAGDRGTPPVTADRHAPAAGWMA